MVDIKLQDADKSRHHHRTCPLGDGQIHKCEPHLVPSGRVGNEALGPAAPLTQALFDAFQRSSTMHQPRGEGPAGPHTLAITLPLPAPRRG